MLLYIKFLTITWDLGFFCSEDSSQGFLGCDTVQCCRRLPVFQMTLPLPSSNIWNIGILLQPYPASQNMLALQNIGIITQRYTESQPRRPRPDC